ncbi:hypothetical protein [Streptomyces sp. NPDC050164]|uniref:hypothetical protein n=1 Tax=Streptomyces sp. NPDC050164 TaxID=3365605 RepID=UPI003799ACAF
MRRLIRKLVGWVRLFCASATQSTELRMSLPVQWQVVRPTSPTLAPTVQAWYEPLDGTATPLVRPYLTAYEREEKARLQRLRRDTLWLAAYGVDLDTRDIHACLREAS